VGRRRRKLEKRDFRWTGLPIKFHLHFSSGPEEGAVLCREVGRKDHKLQEKFDQKFEKKRQGVPPNFFLFIGPIFFFVGFSFLTNHFI